MRKAVIITVICSFELIAMPVIADPFGHGDGYYGGTANWDRKGGYYEGRGGEFTIWDPAFISRTQPMLVPQVD